MQFSTKFSNAKTKVIMQSNHTKTEISSGSMETGSKVHVDNANCGKIKRVRANHDDFGLTSDWLGKWREFFFKSNA